MLNFSACVNWRLREAGLGVGLGVERDWGEFIEVGCVCATAAPDIVFLGTRNYRLQDLEKERLSRLLSHFLVSIHSYSHAH